MAAVKLENSSLVKLCEVKVLSGIYHVMKTTNGEFALASQSGLYFCQYSSIEQNFTLQKDFYLADYIVTQVVEVAPNKFAAGIWGEAFVALVNRGDRSTVKIRCQMADET